MVSIPYLRYIFGSPLSNDLWERWIKKLPEARTIVLKMNSHGIFTPAMPLSTREYKYAKLKAANSAAIPIRINTIMIEDGWIMYDLS